MSKEKVFQLIEQHLELFPDTGDEIATLVEKAIIGLQKKKLAEVDNKYIIPLIQKDIPTATIRAKQNAAFTLKHFTQEKEGVNVSMPHLQNLQPMTRSNHFNTLCKHGFIERLGRGSFRLSKKGWQLLAKAYKISEEDKKPKPAEDNNSFQWI